MKNNNMRLISKYGCVMITNDLMYGETVDVSNVEKFIIDLYYKFRIVVKDVDKLLKINKNAFSTYTESLYRCLNAYYGLHNSRTLYSVPGYFNDMRTFDKILSTINHLTGYAFVTFDNVIEYSDDEFVNGVKVIEIKTPVELEDRLIDELCGKVSISEEDADLIFNVLGVIGELYRFDSFNVPNRENRSYYIEWLYDNALYSRAMNQFTTVTDIKRFVDSYEKSNSSRPRKLRKFIAKSINSVIYDGDIEDYYRYKIEWLNIFKAYHLGDYQNRYSRLKFVLDQLRNNKKPEFFNAKLNHYIETKDLENLLELLKTRPGMLVRNFMVCVRMCDNRESLDYVLDALCMVIDRVELKSLIELKNAVNTYNNIYRLFKPNGNVIYRVDNKDRYLSKDFYNNISGVLNSFIGFKMGHGSMYSTLFIDPRLKNIPLPLTVRDMSKSNILLPRFSRIKLNEETKYIRSFIHWDDSKDKCIDVDLSLTLLDGNLSKMADCYYGNIDAVAQLFEVYSSGDMRQSNSSEYMEFNINNLKDKGIRYVFTTVNVYDGPNFSDIDTCISGLMELDSINTESSFFDISNVRIKSDITSEYKSSIPCFIDLYEREIIWVDMISTDITSNGISVRNDSFTVRNVIISSLFAKMHVSVADFFNMYGDKHAARVRYLPEEEFVNIENKDNCMFVGMSIGDVKVTEPDSIIKYL